MLRWYIQESWRSLNWWESWTTLPWETWTHQIRVSWSATHKVFCWCWWWWWRRWLQTLQIRSADISGSLIRYRYRRRIRHENETRRFAFPFNLIRRRWLDNGLSPPLALAFAMVLLLLRLCTQRSHYSTHLQCACTNTASPLCRVATLSAPATAAAAVDEINYLPKRCGQWRSLFVWNPSNSSERGKSVW